jgi:hypothetical protein
MFRLVFAAALLLAPVAVQAASPKPPTLEQRLQKVEDELALNRLIQDYTVRLTSRDFDGYVALFAPNGTWRNGATLKTGHAEIKAMLVAMFPNTPAGYVNNNSYMLVSNIRLDIDGDHAKGWSRQLSIIRGKDGDPTPVLSGMYEDEFVRLNGQWKILHRNDITFIPTPEIWQKKMASGMFQD